MIISEQNYVNKAEEVIKGLKAMKNPRTGKDVPMVTTSKIRNLLSMTADIYNDVLLCRGDEIGTDLTGRIEYLRVRFIYESGRDTAVRNFVEAAEIIGVLGGINGSKQNYILFSRYMEALVAFHKYYGGKDN